jgi:hypothetical protein
VNTLPVLRKVIGFDSWTGGVQNFERIARELTARGCEFRVVHIGSWGGDAGRPATERIDGVEYRDIRAYGTNRLVAVLEAERPDAVVFLSVDTFAHRAVNRLAQRRRIPTLNVYHGLVSVQEVGPVRAYKVNWVAQARFILERIPKALRRIWPAYASALWHTGAKVSDWARFAGDIFVMASGRRPHTAAPDARTDKCCVYVDADAGHALQRYGFRPEDVVAVGNPDLARFGLASADVGSHLEGAGTGTEVMYIDTGLVYTGLVFKSRAQFVQHLVATREALSEQGLALVFKPHPDHLRSGMMDELATAGIATCSREEFMPRLRRCKAAIVEPSSLSVMPALMGMPLFLAQYGPLAGQRYGQVLTSYPRHHLLQDCTRVGDLLAAPSADHTKAKEWIARNAGPLPAEAMPARVVDLLAQMAAAARADAATARPAAPRVAATTEHA